MKRAFVSLLVLTLGGCSPKPRDKPLTIALPGDLLSLDPNQEVEAITDSVLSNVYEPLVGLDADVKVRTMLAESWEHPSPERWRFRLRRGARFQDGTPVTAAAVRESLLDLRQAPDLEAAQFFNKVVDVVAVDRDSLEVVTREPRALLASLAFLYVTKPNAPGAFPKLLGTGPYRLREWKPGERIVLERFPDYWGGAAEFSPVTFVPQADTERRLALLDSGAADIAYAITPELAERPSPGVRFLHRTGLTVYYLGLNVRRPPFSDPKIRKALHLALNREEMLSRVLKGSGAVPTQLVSPLVFGYHPGLPLPRYDPVESRRLLEQSSRKPRLRVRLDFPAPRLAVARLLQEQLDRVGISVELNALEGEAVYEMAKAGMSDLFFAGWDCTTGEASEFYEFCLHTPAKGYGLGNHGGYSNRRVDEIAETNAAILDQRQRQAVLQEAAAIVMDDLPLLPLYVQDDIYAVRAGVTFEPRADNEIRLLDVKSLRR